MQCSTTSSRMVYGIGSLMLCFFLVLGLTGCDNSSSSVKPEINSTAITEPASYDEAATETIAEVTSVLLEASAVVEPPEPTKIPYEMIAMPNITLMFPAELCEYMEHEQSVYGQAVTEVFYMKTGTDSIPLYRIDVGDERLGDWFGMLKMETEEVPITCTVFAVTEEQLAALDEGASDIYVALMSAFEEMLKNIIADECFIAERPLSVDKNEKVKLAYWTVNIPENMTVEETNTEDTYVAMFHGEVAGERIALYSVHIGEDKAESELGLFEINGVKKPISVGSFDLPENPNWTDDDYSAAYRMMDTINDVINTIMSSEAFSVPEHSEQ